MRFTVTWDAYASNDLALLWLASPDPKAITDAADQIDLVLTFHPDRSRFRLRWAHPHRSP